MRLLLMENVFDLGELRVKDAMRSPAGTKVLHVKASWADNLKVIRETRYSRFPLVEDGQSLPLGIVHVKDILLNELNRQEAPDLRSILRPYLKVTEDLPLEKLLSQLQRLRRRAAIVVDRKGQWTGFITLEDVIEEIIGSVEDEFEKEPPVFLADSMTPDRIVLELTGSDINDVVPKILAHVPDAELPAPRDRIVRAVLEREATMSTYLGHGLAVPHARLDGLQNPVVLFAQSRQGIPVKGSAERIHLIFMLLTPISAPQFQVRLLARISGLMQNEYVVERLRDTGDAATLLEIIRAADPVVLG
jgi:tellurite resistance protein TerC